MTNRTEITKLVTLLLSWIFINMMNLKNALSSLITSKALALLICSKSQSTIVGNFTIMVWSQSIKRVSPNQFVVRGLCVLYNKNTNHSYYSFLILAINENLTTVGALHFFSVVLKSVCLILFFALRTNMMCAIITTNIIPFSFKFFIMNYTANSNARIGINISTNIFTSFQRIF